MAEKHCGNCIHLSGQGNCYHPNRPEYPKCCVLSEQRKTEIKSAITLIEELLKKGPSERDYCPLCQRPIYSATGLKAINWLERLKGLKEMKKEIIPDSIKTDKTHTEIVKKLIEICTESLDTEGLLESSECGKVKGLRMNFIPDILQKMVKVCPVRCSVFVLMDSDYPDEIKLQWRWKIKDKALQYSIKINLLEIYKSRINIVESYVLPLKYVDWQNEDITKRKDET